MNSKFPKLTTPPMTSWLPNHLLQYSEPKHTRSSCNPTKKKKKTFIKFPKLKMPQIFPEWALQICSSDEVSLSVGCTWWRFSTGSQTIPFLPIDPIVFCIATHRPVNKGRLAVSLNIATNPNPDRRTKFIHARRHGKDPALGGRGTESSLHSTACQVKVASAGLAPPRRRVAHLLPAFVYITRFIRDLPWYG